MEAAAKNRKAEETPADDDHGRPAATHVKNQTGPSSTPSRDKPRQKRWAPKLKTGCKTCRARRVKCDETKPYCKQCTSRGKWCEGYGMTPPVLPQLGQKPQGSNESTVPAVIIPPGGAPRTARRPGALPRAHVSTQPAPPSWDLMEALRYFYGVMAPEYIQNSLGDSEYDGQFLAPPTFIIEHSFLMVVTAHRIRTACRVSGVLPAPDQMPTIGHIWARFHHHMIQSLDNVNRQISGPEAAVGVFYRIMDILHVELTLLSPTWRGHIEGCATLIRLYGGVQRVLKLSAGKPSPILAIQLILIIATLANTTTPADDQMDGFSDWSEKDIRTVYSTTMYSEVPCPTELFLNIIEISRLRALTTSSPPYAEDISTAILNVLGKIEAFVPEDWTEPYTVPEKPEMTLIARIYKSATNLYAMLSLPMPILTSSDSNQPAPRASHQRSKAAARARLFQEVTDAMGTLKPNLSMSWPLAVLGASLMEGPSAERVFVEKSLRSISRTPQVYYGPTMSLVKLLAFWDSGKTGWDDCFDEPCSVMA